MNAENQRRLERELSEDYKDIEPAKESRLDLLVREYLLHKATLLADTKIRNEQEVLSLIHLHSRVALLHAVIERPKQFNLKEMKELFRGTLIVEANDAAEAGKRGDPGKTIAELPITDEAKELLFGALTDAAKDRFRAQIASGPRQQ